MRNSWTLCATMTAGFMNFIDKFQLTRAGRQNRKERDIFFWAVQCDSVTVWQWGPIIYYWTFLEDLTD